jgi:Icc-related predicted phosphoesterase
MKIVAVSDFDNGLPKNLSNRIKKENPHFILAGGDFCYGTKIRDIQFKHYDSNEEWYDIVGRKKAAKMMIESVRRGDKVLKMLNSIGVPVFLVFGNHDKTGTESKRKGIWSLYKKNLFSPLLKKYKNIYEVDLGAAKIGEYFIVGYGQNCSAPELPINPSQRKGLTKRDLKKSTKKIASYMRSLNVLFKKVNPKKTIFLVHNVPYNTKLDKITSKLAPKSVRGKHYGSIVARKAVEKYKPLMCVGGHMHENPGVIKLRRTVCVNDGPAADGRYAVIVINNSKIKVILRK